MTMQCWFDDIQKSLKEIPTFVGTESTFVLHPMYRVAVTCQSHETLEKIFGSATVGSFLHSLGNLVNLEWVQTLFKPFKALLPSDSIIFCRTDKKGIIVASAKFKIVLKVFLDPQYAVSLDEEIQTLQKIQSTDFAPYTAKILNHGTTTNGARWLISSFCGNTEAIKNHLLPELYLLENFERLIMPPMTTYYRANQPQVLEIQAWLERAKKRAEDFSSPLLLKKLFKSVQLEALKHPQYRVVESGIHHDLHAGNILIENGKLAIIDWEGAVRGLTLIDVFDFPRRFIKAHLFQKFLFKLFLSAKLARLPSRIQSALDFYKLWNKTEFDVEVPEGSETLTILIYALERTLILHEKRGVNRLKDKRGFELMVLNQYLKRRSVKAVLSSSKNSLLSRTLEEMKVKCARKSF